MSLDTIPIEIVDSAGQVRFSRRISKDRLGRAETLAQQQGDTIRVLDQAPTVNEPPPDTALDTAGDLFRGVAQGATMDFGDELVGAPASLVTGRSVGEEIEAQRTANREAMESSPIAYRAGEAAGFLAPLLATRGAAAVTRAPALMRLLGLGGGAARGASLASRGAKVAGLGAAEGGLIGLGASESGDPLQALGETAAGAALGTVAAPVGAAASSLLTVPGRALRAFAPAVRREGNVRRVAATLGDNLEEVRERLQRAGRREDDLGAGIEELAGELRGAGFKGVQSPETIYDIAAAQARESGANLGEVLAEGTTRHAAVPLEAIGRRLDAGLGGSGRTATRAGAMSGRLADLRRGVDVVPVGGEMSNPANAAYAAALRRSGDVGRDIRAQTGAEMRGAADRVTAGRPLGWATGRFGNMLESIIRNAPEGEGAAAAAGALRTSAGRLRSGRGAAGVEMVPIGHLDVVRKEVGQRRFAPVTMPGRERPEASAMRQMYGPLQELQREALIGSGAVGAVQRRAAASGGRAGQTIDELGDTLVGATRESVSPEEYLRSLNRSYELGSAVKQTGLHRLGLESTGMVGGLRGAVYGGGAGAILGGVPGAVAGMGAGVLSRRYGRTLYPTLLEGLSAAMQKGAPIGRLEQRVMSIENLMRRFGPERGQFLHHLFQQNTMGDAGTYHFLSSQTDPGYRQGLRGIESDLGGAEGASKHYAPHRYR